MSNLPFTLSPAAPLSLLNDEQRNQAQADLGVGTLYLHAGHEISSEHNSGAWGISTDGVNVTPVGDTYQIPPQAAGDGVRDTIPFYWEPTGEFLFLSTHSTNDGDDYALTLTLHTTRSLSRIEETFEIPINGAGLVNGDAVWSGCLFRDEDGSLYATCSHLVDSDVNNLVIGWIKFNQPGVDWTDVTDFVAFSDTNPNIATFIAAQGLVNDISVHPRKIGGLYYYTLDGGPNGTHKIWRSSSSVLFEDMSAPVELGIFDLMTLAKTATIANGDATVTVADTSNLLVNMVVIGTGIPALAQVASITDSTHFELSAPATADNAAASLTFTADVEGSYTTETPEGNIRCYFQAIFGPVRYTDTANFTDADPTWSAQALVRWNGRLPLGNGGVIRVTNLAAQAIMASASASLFLKENDGITFSTLNFPTDNGRIYVGGSRDGNGFTGSTIAASASKSGSVVNWAFTGNVSGVYLFSALGIVNSYSPGGFARMQLEQPTRVIEWIDIYPTQVWRLNMNGAGFVNLMTLADTGNLTLAGGVQTTTNAASVASGAWYDNAGVWTKKP